MNWGPRVWFACLKPVCQKNKIPSSHARHPWKSNEEQRKRMPEMGTYDSNLLPAYQPVKQKFVASFWPRCQCRSHLFLGAFWCNSSFLILVLAAMHLWSLWKWFQRPLAKWWPLNTCHVSERPVVAPILYRVTSQRDQWLQKSSNVSLLR